MEDQVLDRLNNGYITTIGIYCRKIVVIKDRILLDMFKRYHYYRNVFLEQVDLAYDIYSSPISNVREHVFTYNSST